LRNVRMEQGMPKKEKPGPSYRGGNCRIEKSGCLSGGVLIAK
jgi:hypothetical protein